MSTDGVLSQPIEVRALVASKNKRLSKLIPPFIYSYLKRILHIDIVNLVIEKYNGLNAIEFSQKVLEIFDVTYEIEGADKLNRDGRYLIVSNHPLGGLDGVTLIDYFGRFFPKIYFPVNDFLLHLPAYADVFLPINKHGAQSLSAARKINEVYASAAQILYFPAGLCSRKRRGKIRDLQWQSNFVAKAIEYQRNVVPIYFEGHNSAFFYNLAAIRQRLGIKVNIEMLYLVDEMVKQKGAKLKIHVGDPVSYTRIKANKENYSRDEWAHWFKAQVYHMSEKLHNKKRA